MDTTSRDSLIARLRKLASMTTDRGASEAEAARAAELIAKMMAEHNIGRDEFSIKADAEGCITDFFTVMSASWQEWRGLPSAIHTLFECRSHYSNHREDPLDLGIIMDTVHVSFYGFPADVVAAVSLFGICVTAVNTESAAWRPAGKRKTNRLAQDFRLGMIARLAERIKALVPPRAAQPTGRGLIVLKQQLVNQSYHQAFPHMGGAGRAMAPVNAAAYAAGQAAGSRASLGAAGSPQVGGRRLITGG